MMEWNRRKRIQAMIVLGLVLLMGAVASGCGGSKVENPEPEASGGAGAGQGNPLVVLEMDNGDQVKIELYPTIAPNTVNNFISLIDNGHYDGLIFHRVIPGFMVQGGDPEGTGGGGPGYSIAGEFTENGFENNLRHSRGVLSMARTGDPNSAGSQFFIMVDDAPSLDNKYASFGMVIEGMEAVDRIVNTKRDAADKPLEDMRIKTVSVDTFGVVYDEPVKFE